MSIETWKEAFYPVDAYDVKDEAAALAHSLRKWEGLRAENLTAHGLHRAGAFLCDGSNRRVLAVTQETCSLCVLFLTPADGDDDYGEELCGTCPLFKARGGMACCDSDEDSEEVDPYNSFTNSGDPEPMIALIRKAQGASAERAKD